MKVTITVDIGERKDDKQTVSAVLIKKSGLYKDSPDEIVSEYTGRFSCETPGYSKTAGKQEEWENYKKAMVLLDSIVESSEGLFLDVFPFDESDGK